MMGRTTRTSYKRFEFFYEKYKAGEILHVVKFHRLFGIRGVVGPCPLVMVSAELA